MGLPIGQGCPPLHIHAAGGTIPELQPQHRDGLLILQEAFLLPAK